MPTSVASIAADLEITAADTQRKTVKANGFAKYRCGKGCKFTSQLGCIQINCKKFYVQKYYVQRCKKHNIDCKPWFDPDLLEAIIENGLLRSLRKPQFHFTGNRAKFEAHRPPHIPPLCEACNFGETVIH